MIFTGSTQPEFHISAARDADVVQREYFVRSYSARNNFASGACNTALKRNKRDTYATAGNTDVAQFMTSVATNQLWFQHTGNNLEVSIIGTADKLVVKDWYLGTANLIEQFKTTDGAKTLLDSQVESLVAAMAVFVPPTAGQTTLPLAYQTSLNTVIAANRQ